jgi:FkbM family methyltransferase
VRVAQPDLFVEAGAKDASTSRRARTIVEDARVVAFEANPYVYERFLDDDFARHRVEYRHLALSDTTGPVTFNVRRSDEGAPRADGKGSLKQRVRDARDPEQVEVQATTLDDFFADAEITSCALWVDVEGATDRVLCGGRDLLSRAAVVVVEVEDVHDWVWGPAWTAHDVSAHLFDLGLVPVARDYQSRHQYNVVYVSAALLRDHRFRVRLAEHRSAALRRPAGKPRKTTGATPRRAAPVRTSPETAGSPVGSRGPAGRGLRRVAARMARPVRARRRRRT